MHIPTAQSEERHHPRRVEQSGADKHEIFDQESAIHFQRSTQGLDKTTCRPISTLLMACLYAEPV